MLLVLQFSDEEGEGRPPFVVVVGAGFQETRLAQRPSHLAVFLAINFLNFWNGLTELLSYQTGFKFAILLYQPPRNGITGVFHHAQFREHNPGYTAGQW